MIDITSESIAVLFGKRIKDLRNSRGMIQTDLADVLEMSHAAVAMWETGKREPGFENIVKIADYFNVSADYLLCRIENNEPLNVDWKIRAQAAELELRRLRKLASDFVKNIADPGKEDKQ